MSNEDLVPVVAQILSDNDAINAASDGFIYPGIPGPSVQDASLAGAHQTAIWVRDISMTEKPYIGTSDCQFDQLIQIDVLSRDSEHSAKALAKLITTLMKATKSYSYGGALIPTNFFYHSPINTYDEKLTAWVQTRRFRAIGAYV